MGGFFAVGFLAVLTQAAGLAFFVYSPLKPGTNESAIIEIRKGQGPKEIAKLLTQAGSIEDAQKFIWAGRVLRKFRKIKAGEYKVSASMTPLEILNVITSGISVAHPITVREGENMYEVAADLEAKKLATRKQVLDLCRSPKFIASLGLEVPQPPSLEGYLFPETYFFNKSMPVEEMLKQMVKTFYAVWGKKEESRARELGLNAHQLITLASIVEKETGAPQERPLIASVFYNRLKKRMKLQSDPTTIYGIWESYKGNLHKSDLLSSNPYNTYYVFGLPAGPIGNPGREAIQAALNPAASNYLYFVSHNDGTHQFSQSLEEHNAAVRRFQLDPKARDGKSWRNLTKSKSNS